jgi:hypothetical protein
MHRYLLGLCLLGLLQSVRTSSILFSGGTVIAFDQSTEGLQVLRNYSVLVVDDRVQSIFADPSNTTILDGTENRGIPLFLILILAINSMSF